MEPNQASITEVEGGSHFDHNYYVAKTKHFTFANEFRIFDDTGSLVLFCKQKMFKLKEDIRLYTSEEMTEESLTIKARQIMDFSAAYDVFDSKTNEKVGALKRKGWNSLIRDSWIIMDPKDREIGSLSEDNMTLAIVRRLLMSLIPQNFSGFIGEEEVFELRQKFNPFSYTMNIDFTKDATGKIDRRLGLAIASLICCLEGRQQ